jgi:PST family polysaccharide transporter
LEPLDTRSAMGRKGLHATVMLMASQFGKLVLLLLSTVVLVRLLPPHDFGLMAMAATVTNFMILFKDVGLTAATAQQHTLSHAQVSSLFWLNQLFALALTGLTLLMAPVLGVFYAQPELVPGIMVMAVGFMLGGLGAQHDALLRRTMRFGSVAVIDVSAVALGVMAAVALALEGWGWWALVAQRLVQLAFYSTACWLVCGWRPGLVFRWQEIKQQFHFGAHVSLFNLANYGSRNGDNILIGWYWGAVQLGFYAKAYDMLVGPLFQLTQPLSNLMQPLLGRLRDQPKRYKAAYHRVVMPANLLLLPLGGIMLVFPDAAVRLVFGNGWEAAVPVVFWLSLAVMTQVVGSSSGWLFISQQRSGSFALVGLVTAAITLASFAVGLTYGIGAVACAYVLGYVVVQQPVMFWLAGKQGPVQFKDIYATLLPTLAAAAVLMPILVILKYSLLMGAHAFVQVVVAGLAGALVLPLSLLMHPYGKAMWADIMLVPGLLRRDKI